MARIKKIPTGIPITINILPKSVDPDFPTSAKAPKNNIRITNTTAVMQSHPFLFILAYKFFSVYNIIQKIFFADKWYTPKLSEQKKY